MIWLRRLLLAALGLALLTVLLAAGGLTYTYRYISTEPRDDPPVPLLSHLQPVRAAPATLPPWQQAALAHRNSPVDLQAFAHPPLQFGPWTRWWWPGNLVSTAGLEREMQLFANNGIAGVEIQPFAISLSEQDIAAPRWSEAGWDSPDFYANLRTVMHSARQLGMQVDLNNGSGWPSGGPHVALEDGLRQLLHSEVFVQGPRLVKTELPAPSMPVAAFAAGAVGMLGETPMQVFAPERRQLVAVTAARVLNNGRTWQPWDFTDQVQLDPASVTDISDAMSGNTLRWQAPPGDWAITALWQMPGGELIAGGYAHPQPGYVVDHLDASRMRANQDYLFRAETGLAEYFGDPLRAFFNDSLEFRQERHWARNHLQEFERRKGYAPGPWLAALPEPGHDQMPFHAMNIATRAEYDLGEMGKRFLEDWQQVTSDLFRESYFQPLAQWGAERGLAHRLQAYGGPVDIIRAAGESHIPEAEQLYAGGSEMFLKAVSSGAHIAGRPIVSAESFIFVGKAFMTTPLKVKALADKAFAAGINQLVYHGSSYQIEDHEARGYPVSDGWYPWQLGMLSMDFSEHWAFWSHAKTLNRYMARNQYLLRKGEPETDVLVLYPHIGFPQGYSNPEEAFDQGRFPGEGTALPADTAAARPGVRWMRDTWRYTRRLEQRGLHWEWINQHALASATVDRGRLHAGGLSAGALLLHNIEALSPESAEHIARLAGQGLPVRILGDTPQRQMGLGYRGQGNYATGDARVRAALARVTNEQSLPEPPIRFDNVAVKSIRRRLPGGQLLQFFSNPTAKNTTVSLRLQEKHDTALWLNAWTGTAEAATTTQDNTLELILAPYASRILWLGASNPGSAPAPTRKPVLTTTLEHWDFHTQDNSYASSGDLPGNWSTIAELQYSSAHGIYSTNIDIKQQRLDALAAGHQLALELGELNGAADIFVNDKFAGSALLPPYTVDIGKFLQASNNHLRIVYTPPRKNRIVREISTGAQGWNAPDLGNQAATVAAGITGPVRLVETAPGQTL